MDPRFLDFMPHTVTVSTGGALDQYGQPAWGTPKSYRARVEQAKSQYLDANGNKVTLSYVAWINSTAAISPLDKVTLPNGEAPKIMRVDMPPDENGIHHCKVMFG